MVMSYCKNKCKFCHSGKYEFTGQKMISTYRFKTIDHLSASLRKRWSIVFPVTQPGSITKGTSLLGIVGIAFYNEQGGWLESLVNLVY